ncbi:protein-L-isoaspartate O-methyltransferase [Streptomyces sp. NPDC056084]|uniref:protein-L-isoaspartate O-methyltransferase family protein n=1 Tax=unclassified Streptomyces TaxID=2593676 RepID=UPI0035DACED1
MDYQEISRKELEAMGAFRSPWLRPAFNAVDREAFAPAQFWGYDTDSEGLHEVIDRDKDEDAWRRAVWGTHRSLITQMDDGIMPEHGPARGDFTSSISALDIVFEKLNRLDAERGSRVLHIGTASGYDSALLCELVGSDRLTTVEFDPALASWGRANLERSGYAPATITGDGLEGHAPNAPYDRIIATAAVRDIPAAWRRQAAAGALILTPYNTLFASGGLLKLAVLGGVASGKFVGGASYMWVRSHRPNTDINPPGEPRKSASVIDPDELFGGDWSSRFALGLFLPDIAYAHRGQGESRQVQLWDEAGTSVALVVYDEWWRPDAVVTYGPRDLWSELVGAYTAWRLEGQPHFERFGLTFTDDGQHLWLDEPTNVMRSSLANDSLARGLGAAPREE